MDDGALHEREQILRLVIDPRTSARQELAAASRAGLEIAPKMVEPG